MKKTLLFYLSVILWVEKGPTVHANGILFCNSSYPSLYDNRPSFSRCLNTV